MVVLLRYSEGQRSSLACIDAELSRIRQGRHCRVDLSRPWTNCLMNGTDRVPFAYSSRVDIVEGHTRRLIKGHS